MGDLSKEMIKRYFDAATVMVDQEDRAQSRSLMEINRTIHACIALQTIVLQERELEEGNPSEHSNGSLTSMSSSGLVDSEDESGTSGEEEITEDANLENEDEYR
jgi:hypothetical protein